MDNPRNYPGLLDNEADIARAVNALRDAISLDVAALLGSGVGGDLGGVVTSVNVAANNANWTDAGLTLGGEDALVLRATGAISHNATDALYGPLHATGASLVWVIVGDGSTPDGDVSGQNDYKVTRTAYRKSGRVWLRVRDAGGVGDNRGSFDVALRYYADPGEALAPLS